MVGLDGVALSAEARKFLKQVEKGKTDGIAAWFDSTVQQTDHSRIQGYGLIARSDIPAHTLVAIKQGYVLTENEVREFADIIHGSHQQIGVDRFLSGRTASEVKKNLIGFNHSCVPNAYIKLTDNFSVAFLVTRKPIVAGREITTDYGVWGDSATHFIADCSCGARSCRQVIDPTRDWQNREFQERFVGEFPTFMQEKIDRLTQVDLMNRPILT